MHSLSFPINPPPPLQALWTYNVWASIMLQIIMPATMEKTLGIFSVCPPPPPPSTYVPPVTEHVPLHSKSSYKNVARASRACK